MKRLGLFVLLSSLTAGAFAQDLDLVTITDQYNVNSRSSVTPGTGTFGAAATDGSEFLDYTGTDATAIPTTAIRYINSWNLDGILEAPVITVTSNMNNPDRGLTGNIPAVPANTRPGATGASTAVQIGDDGGYNALFFGDSDDSDYYVEVDLYCPGLSAGATFAPGTPFEVAGVSVRAGRDNDFDYNEFTYSPDRTPSYGLYYDYYKQEVKAVRWKLSNTTGEIQNRNTSASVELGSLPMVAGGWHTMRVECSGTKIVFKVDGLTIASINDSVTNIDPVDLTQTTFDFGRPCLYYREAFVASANEKQALFDNLKAGPTPPVSSVNDWTLY